MSGIKLATIDRKDWATPSWLFDHLNLEFGFAIDVCANAENAKCLRFFDAERDALSLEWRGSIFMNPPYGRELEAWMRKAVLSVEQHGATVVALLPARTDVIWWHRYAMRGELRFVKGRLKFAGAKWSAPFPSVVVVLAPGIEPGLGPSITRSREQSASGQTSLFAMNHDASRVTPMTALEGRLRRSERRAVI